MNKLTIRNNRTIELDGHTVAKLTPDLFNSPILRERLQKAFKQVELPKIEEPQTHQA